MTDQRRIYQEVFTVADTSIDVQGHVNNREYLRWMEGVATRHAALLGWDFETLKARNRSWVAREHWRRTHDHDMGPESARSGKPASVCDAA